MTMMPYWPMMTLSESGGIWRAPGRVLKWYTCGRRHYWKKDRRLRREQRRIERKAARREEKLAIGFDLAADGLELLHGEVFQGEA